MTEIHTANGNKTGERFRLCTEQDGAPLHVGSVVLSREEARESLETEAWLHEAAQWRVDRFPGMVRAERGDVVRWIWTSRRQPFGDEL
jgi:hypothetical protein